MLHELTAHVKRATEDDGVQALLLSAVRVSLFIPTHCAIRRPN